jgi:adenine deaminase
MKFEDALISASKMCSMNPANILGLEKTGTIKTGSNADILITDIIKSNNNFKININKVLLKGNTLFTN